MGLYDWQTEGSRQSSRREKTERDLSLESQFGGDSDVGSRISFFGLVSTEEIEIPFDCGAGARNKLQVLDAVIPDLHTDSILAVLDDSVMQLQFPLRGQHVVGSKACVVELAEDAELPVVIGLINQRRLGEHCLKSKLVAEDPDNPATWRDSRVLIKRPPQTDHRKDLIFLQRKGGVRFDRDVERVASNVILKINSRV